MEESAETKETIVIEESIATEESAATETIVATEEAVEEEGEYLLAKKTLIKSGGITQYAYEYDANGNVVKYITSKASEEGFVKYIMTGNVEVSVSSIVEYTNDEAGNAIAAVTYDGDGNVTASRTIQNTYNEEGSLLTASTYRPDGSIVSKVTYDDAGNVTEQIGYDESGNIRSAYTQVYQYDATGNVTEVKIYNNDAHRSTYEYTYDDAGNKLIKKTYTMVGDLESTTEYKYDDAGNLIEESDGSNITLYEYDLLEKEKTETSQAETTETIETTVQACNHKWVDKVDAEATCSIVGKGHIECSECGTVKERYDIPKNYYHAECTVLETTEATCEMFAMELLKCNACGEMFERELSFKLASHKDENGDKKCDVCGGKISE